MQCEFYTFYFYFLNKNVIIKNIREKFEIDTEILFPQICKPRMNIQTRFKSVSHSLVLADFYDPLLAIIGMR